MAETTDAAAKALKETSEKIEVINTINNFLIIFPPLIFVV